MCAMASSSKGKRKRKAGDEEEDICPACAYFKAKDAYIKDHGLAWGQFKKDMLPPSVANWSKKAHRRAERHGPMHPSAERTLKSIPVSVCPCTPSEGSPGRVPRGSSGIGTPVSWSILP